MALAAPGNLNSTSHTFSGVLVYTLYYKKANYQEGRREAGRSANTRCRPLWETASGRSSTENGTQSCTGCHGPEHNVTLFHSFSSALPGVCRLRPWFCCTVSQLASLKTKGLMAPIFRLGAN